MKLFFEEMILIIVGLRLFVEVVLVFLLILMEVLS